MEKKLGYNIYQCQMVSSGVVSNGVEWCGVKWCRVSVMTLESLLTAKMEYSVTYVVPSLFLVKYTKAHINIQYMYNMYNSKKKKLCLELF